MELPERNIGFLLHDVARLLRKRFDSDDALRMIVPIESAAGAIEPGRRKQRKKAKLISRSGRGQIGNAPSAELFHESIVVGVGDGRKLQNDLLDFGDVEKCRGPLALDDDPVAHDAERRVDESLAVQFEEPAEEGKQVRFGGE